MIKKKYKLVFILITLFYLALSFIPLFWKDRVSIDYSKLTEEWIMAALDIAKLGIITSLGIWLAEKYQENARNNNNIRLKSEAEDAVLQANTILIDLLNRALRVISKGDDGRLEIALQSSRIKFMIALGIASYYNDSVRSAESLVLLSKIEKIESDYSILDRAFKSGKILFEHYDNTVMSLLGEYSIQ